MKTTILILLAMTATLSAKADGFKCEGVNTGINVKVFNHTDPTQGTRAVAVMVVSDSFVSNPNKAIASFTDENNTLSYLGHGLYQAKVDLRYIESSKKGENIAGTKLGYLKNILLQVYNTGSVMKDGEVTDAKITYVKRNGEILDEKAMCIRYLKN